MGRPAAIRGWGALAIGVALGAAVVVMAWLDATAARPRFGLATMVIGGALAILAATYGLVKLGARAGGSAPTEAAGRGSYRHLVRLVLAVVLVGGGAATARAVFVPKTYGEFGYYRGDAARQAMAAQPGKHQGQAVCTGCHADIPKLHDKDVHGAVECEACHGPGAEHVAFFQKKGMFGSPDVFVPQTKEPCLWCHRRLVARPLGFPQIDPGEHYAFLGVSDPHTPCMRCHNPHEPLFLDKPLQQARLHPAIQRCRDCHPTPVDASAARPDDHPVVFECSYCHSAVARDFQSRAHRGLECSKCHLYHPESETAGRIVKIRDPRFCLLCHEKQPFRGRGSPPLVESASHGEGEANCLECHADGIHGNAQDRRQATGGPS